MATDRKFYRTVIQVEVLSEDPYDLSIKELSDVAWDITEGHFNGDIQTLVENEEIDEARTIELLVASGSDPGFFGLDDDDDGS